MRVFFFVCKVVDKICFSWWYDPWRQRRANEALWYDVQREFYFLTSIGELVKSKKLEIHPFDYASIRVVLKNLCFRFTRGRGEFNALISPVCCPNDSYYLEWVLAALDSSDRAETQRVDTLNEVAQVLRSRLDEINESFSATKYPGFREKLLREKESTRILTRQAEWELNQRLYGNRGRTGGGPLL